VNRVFTADDAVIAAPDSAGEQREDLTKRIRVDAVSAAPLHIVRTGTLATTPFPGESPVSLALPT